MLTSWTTDYVIAQVSSTKKGRASVSVLFSSTSAPELLPQGTYPLISETILFFIDLRISLSFVDSSNLASVWGCMAHPQGIRCFILACLYLLVQSSLAYGMDVIITTANLNWIAQVSTIQGGDTVTFYPGKRSIFWSCYNLSHLSSGTYYITQTIQLNLTAPPLFPTKIIGIGATIVSQVSVPSALLARL